MIDLKNLEPNKPKVDFSEYTFLIYGKPKSGKTTLFYELAKEFYNGDLSKALLIGLEKGYKALNGVMAINPSDWKEFEDTVNQLVQDRNELTFKMIGIDTLDVLYNYACDFVVRRERIARKDAKIKTIADVPWGAGYSMVGELIEKCVNRLINAGYGLFLISHNTEKKITQRDGKEYDQTTVSLPTRARNIFINMSDFIIFVDIEKSKEGKTLVDNRYIYFRSDGDIEAGSRFQNVPDRIEYDAKQFLEAFKEAVESNFSSVEEMKQAKIEQAEEKEKQVQEFIENDSKYNVEDLIEQVAEKIKGASKEIKSRIKSVFKENFDSHDYKKYDGEQLAQALGIIDEIKNEKE
jgi:DNA polymerase III delta prime subunit